MGSSAIPVWNAALVGHGPKLDLGTVQAFTESSAIDKAKAKFRDQLNGRPQGQLLIKRKRVVAENTPPIIKRQQTYFNSRGVTVQGNTREAFHKV